MRLVMVALAVTGLAAATPGVAQAAPSLGTAAAGTVAASPATGLAASHRVTVTVTGLSPEALVGQCAMPNGALVCNPGSMVQFATDSAGKGTRTVTVNKSFQGYTLNADGSVQPWGPVTCSAATPCSMGATDGVQVLITPLSFR